MRTEQPKLIRLVDYQQPDYLIDETHLTFELYEDHALVHAHLVMQRNPALGCDLPKLVLDGVELQLLHLAMDDQVLTAADYQVDAEQLSLQPLRPSFTLDSTVRIEPQNNTALEGLYKSGGMFCTQCEAQGFRKITYYLDRPDVMSSFTTTVIAETQRYPILLSNGNLIEEGVEDKRHWATWQDPHKKPAYLFAVVAGDLWSVEDSFTTMNGREVTLRIFVEPENIDKCQHAMNSLKKCMRWDEEQYGREYDLDIFMVVAVNDFNMGAMENKGLNIFNSSCVLAKPETSTDATFQRIESIVAHEYFHNWSGNRVTCRDWFQLSLKEGFTVFRDSEFSADMNSRTVKRIEDVTFLRTHQFAEDAGPLAHPVRPPEYMEISNFYTWTIYEKGAEVVRMLHTLLGPERFRQGSDLYFERHDGQAVTCDDFVAAMESVSGMDLTQFKRWYSQAGTPVLRVTDEYDAERQLYHIDIAQSCPATPGQADKQPFVIPVAMGLLGAEGQALSARLQDAEQGATQDNWVLTLNQAQQRFTFTEVSERPLPSLLRGFSAPVKLHYDYSREQLAFLLQHDSDGFNRWEAAQQLAVQVIEEVCEQLRTHAPVQVDGCLAQSFAAVLNNPHLDPALQAEIISLPSLAYLLELQEQAQVQLTDKARETVRLYLAEQLAEPLLVLYNRLREQAKQTQYRPEAEQIGNRRLQAMALSYLTLLQRDDIVAATVAQFEQADNMTERLSALSCLVNSTAQSQAQGALVHFAEEFAHDPLVMDQWFSVQAASSVLGELAHVRQLMQHPSFSIKNPNKVRAVIGAFTQHNLPQFHAEDGSGYVFLAEQVAALDALNPQMSARIITPLTRWQRYAPAQQALMRAQLEQLQALPKLSKDLYEVLERTLA